jgi:hypothetical protein
VTIHVRESNAPQPSELSLDIEQLVRRILRLHGEPDPLQELLVQICVRRRNVLQIAKDSIWVQHPVNLAIQRSLAFVDEMVNGEAGDHGIELTKFGQRIIKIVFYYSHSSIINKPLADGVQHGGREVHRHGIGTRMLSANQSQQAPIASAQIQNSPGVLRNELQQSRFSFHSVGYLVGTSEVVAGVLG